MDRAHPATSSAPAAGRLAAWMVRYRHVVLGASLVVALAAAATAATLPVYADFSYLLPPSAESVRHLRALEKRARVLGTLMVAVTCEQPAACRPAAVALRERFAAIDRALLSDVTFDQSAAHKFAWDNRWLFAEVDDLRAARGALTSRLAAGRRRATPLYVDLEDENDDAAGADAEGDDAGAAAMATLQRRLRAAEALRDDPGELVAPDGKLQLLILRTPFGAGDVGRDGALLAAVAPHLADVRAQHPGVAIGLAGDVLTSRAEQRAILSGMLVATLATVALVVGALLLYFRSWAGVLALFWSLSVGTLVTFALTRLGIGHLNLATAFLASIVVGNGINFGIMLLARYVEALRLGAAPEAALAAAIGGTWRGTLAAALTAAVAYLSLAVTEFRGFRHFGYIGGAGMVLCWLSTYGVMPAALAALSARGWLTAHREPALGRALARLVPRRSGAVVAVAALLTAAAGVLAWHYLANDPYEANFKNLRSDSAELTEERRWMGRIDAAFGQGISGGFVIGVARRDEAQPLAARLRAVDEGKAPRERLFSRLNVLDDALPTHQAEKLALLAELRALLADGHLRGLPAAQRAELAGLRPPAELRPLTDDDVPDALAWPFVEADGSRGKLLLAMSGWGFEIWDAHDLVRFADLLRGMHLGDDVLLGGSAFVFSDILRLVQQDGPRATLAAVLGAMLVILCVVGRGRHAAVTLACGLTGTLLMVAVSSLAGLRVNFLDFVALPITIGIGIDYAVNICARAREDAAADPTVDPVRALQTAGGAVFLSSYTTIVGYASLLLSSNRGIRSFGHAAILGEVTCLLAALLVAPALLRLRGREAP